MGIHESFRNDPVSGLYGDFSVGAHRCVHKKIYRADDEKAFPRRSVDVVKAVRVSVSVLIEKFVHFRAAGGEKQIMGSHIVGKDPEHRAVEIGIKGISCVQLQGSVTIQRDGRGEKFAMILGGNGKEIGGLSAFQIRDREALPSFYIDLPSRTGRKEIFHGKRLLNFRCSGIQNHYNTGVRSFPQKGEKRTPRGQTGRLKGYLSKAGL